MTKNDELSDVKIYTFNIEKRTDEYIIFFAYICYRKWVKKLHQRE